jgi:tetratricopeptide (TPR) repeat protein
MHGVARTVVLVLSAALVLAGCAAAPQTRALLAAPPDGLPQAVELADTPFWPQQRHQCGPAALATVLGAQGVTVEPEQLVDAVYVPALQGALSAELAAAARRYGMLAYPLQPSLQALLTEIAAGNPVLVLQNLGTDWLARWHYAVVIGYDLGSDAILLRSGTTRRWRTSLSTFERTWARGAYWALVVLPPGEMPAAAGSVAYLQAVHDLETAGQPAAALRAYRAAARRWPADPTVWLALGNSLYEAADYTAARAAYTRATALAPADARGWNNLAYALLKTGCPGQARAAALCALRRSPDAVNYRDTLADIDAGATGGDTPDCPPVECEPQV